MLRGKTNTMYHTTEFFEPFFEVLFPLSVESFDMSLKKKEKNMKKSKLSLAPYMTLHFSFSFLVPLSWPFFSSCSEMFLFFSRLSSSANSSFTLWLVLADVSMKWQPHIFASASPSAALTSRFSVSSHLFPTNMIGIDANSFAPPLVSRMTWRRKCNVCIRSDRI